MSDLPRSVEESPLRGMHWRLAIYAGGGEFCDGYILSLIAVALPLLTPQLHLSPGQVGLVGSSALVGIFAGGLLFGYVGDRVGRQPIYIVGIAIFLGASVLSFFVIEPWQIIALRFLMGVAIGSDYAVAGTIVSEFAPRRSRGPLLVTVVTMWYVGAMVAYIVGVLLLPLGDHAWRWMLLSSAVPAVLILFLRRNTPESPRWLANRGRHAEARDVVRKMLDTTEDIDISEVLEPPVKTSYREIFRGVYLKRTIFVCGFWMCQLLPLFALQTYQPQILSVLGLSEGRMAYLGSVVLSMFSVVGLLVSIVLVDRIGRRALLLWSFGVALVPLLILVLDPRPAVVAVVLLFGMYSLVQNMGSGLQSVYPVELFPTRIRGTAHGFAAGMSRVGGAIGTFGAPFLLANGTRTALLVGAGVVVLGLVLTLCLAPETRGLSLREASSQAPEPSVVGNDVPAE